MKKLAIGFLLLAVPFALFSLDFYVGPTAYYASVIQPQSVKNLSPSGMSVSDFAIGGDARLMAGLLWGGVVGLYQPGTDLLPNQLQFMTDVGLGLRILFLRAAIGVGPDFGLAFGNGATQAFRAGANLRLTGDVILGKVSFGLSWLSKIEFTQQSLSDAFSNPYGMLGVAVLFKL
ncbi:MAG TPA: hypothetical protein VMW87_04070 [Spirochaetia bacterium]|nr:hypothetical protein [Spirochaetia bacterium]